MVDCREACFDAEDFWGIGWSDDFVSEVDDVHGSLFVMVVGGVKRNVVIVDLVGVVVELVGVVVQIVSVVFELHVRVVRLCVRLIDIFARVLRCQDVLVKIIVKVVKRKVVIIEIIVRIVRRLVGLMNCPGYRASWGRRLSAWLYAISCFDVYYTNRPQLPLELVYL